MTDPYKTKVGLDPSKNREMDFSDEETVEGGPGLATQYDDEVEDEEEEEDEELGLEDDEDEDDDEDEE